MTEIRFHRELYAESAVEEAAAVYRPHADIEVIADDEGWLVRVETKKPRRQRRIAGELCNYALGLTIQRRAGT